MSNRRARTRTPLKLVHDKREPDFDQASRRVLDAAADAFARELGRTAADEYFDRWLAGDVRKANA